VALEAPSRPEAANFIGGQWSPSASGRTYARRNPARPDEVVGEFPESTPEDLDAAVAAAKGAFPEWSGRPFAARGAVLVKAAALIEERVEEIAGDMTREMGKPLRESRLEAGRAAAIFRFFAGEAFRPVGELFEQAATGSPVYTVHRPVGVVGLITPWNFPAAIPAWKLGPALAYGNTVVMKLAQDSPLTGLHLARALDDAGLPAGVLNVVIGRGSQIGTPLVRHPDVRAISFTGSVAVGEQVRDEATRLGKRVQLELGGQNPLIVMADADLDRAVEAAFAGAFWSAGQKCTATRRIYVQDEAYDDFRARLLARIEAGKVGDPAHDATEVGPLVHEEAMSGVLEAIEQGRREGGSLVAGGGRVGAGYVVAPTVFEDVGDEALLSREEVFGPVTTLYRFATVDEAIARANAVQYGLSASVFTRDIATSQRFVRDIEAGIVHINSQTAGADVHVPFGGTKGSGFGPHEQGRAAREFYTEVVTVYQDA
jgi:acyl-CoA reductase-like NAD-dependent aldehyde dehydrogenase